MRMLPDQFERDMEQHLTLDAVLQAYKFGLRDEGGSPQRIAWERLRLLSQRPKLMFWDDEDFEFELLDNPNEELVDLLSRLARHYVRQDYPEALDLIHDWCAVREEKGLKIDPEIITESGRLWSMKAAPCGDSNVCAMTCPQGQCAAAQVEFAGWGQACCVGRFLMHISIPRPQGEEDWLALQLYRLHAAGRRAAAFLKFLVFSILLSNPALEDGLPLFDGRRGNLVGGLECEFNETNLLNARSAMAARNVQAHHLILSEGMRGEAGSIASRLGWPGAQGLRAHCDRISLLQKAVDPRTGHRLAPQGLGWMLAAEASPAPALLITHPEGRDLLPQLKLSMPEVEEGPLFWEVELLLKVEVANPQSIFMAFGG